MCTLYSVQYVCDMIMVWEEGRIILKRGGLKSMEAEGKGAGAYSSVKGCEKRMLGSHLGLNLK